MPICHINNLLSRDETDNTLHTVSQAIYHAVQQINSYANLFYVKHNLDDHD